MKKKGKAKLQQFTAGIYSPTVIQLILLAAVILVMALLFGPAVLHKLFH